ncbi:hypothetical protein [Kyrpidia sp.]|uniref:GltB/FmdC/FwdC-like GXGXG domain-containing protein n=1 Tax=Kyrpidia sp. TaxID=2073077 RepID=UPI0025877436|nr:hypothetical protein [Kyrpidia sp.]MCL6575032.1 hypothetical protein [Kyrpidia sp.]
MVQIDCRLKSAVDLNREIRFFTEQGESEVHLIHPEGRHNLAVGILTCVRVTVEGTAGYYCGGLCDGIRLDVHGDTGWGLGENLMSGEIFVSGNAGSAAGASMRGGVVRVEGCAGPRAGISMKGGVLIIEGSVGAMSGFMMQKGAMIIGGDAGEGLGDSMYEGVILVGGRIRALGNDAVVTEPRPEDLDLIRNVGLDTGLDWKRVESGKKLWYFNKKEWDVWKVAL